MVKQGRVARLDKNDAHLQGYNSEKSVLDVPFCITDIVERGVPQPKVARFLRYTDGTGRYKRVYEIGFDQYIGKRHPSDPLNCYVVQIVLDYSKPRTIYEQSKNFCLLSFSLHEEFSLPLERDGCVSTADSITKVWPDRTKYNNHTAFFFTGTIPRHLDNRPLGLPIYTKCLASFCFSCRPESAQEAAARQPASQQTAMSISDHAAATTSYAGNTYTTGACNSYDGANYTPYQTHDTTWYGGANYTSYQTPDTTWYGGANYTPYQTPDTTGYGGANYTPYQTPDTTGYGGANYPSLPTTPSSTRHPRPEEPPLQERKETPQKLTNKPPLHLPPSIRNRHVMQEIKEDSQTPSPICNQ